MARHNTSHSNKSKLPLLSDEHSKSGSDFKPTFKAIDVYKNKKLRWFCFILSWLTIFASTSQFTMFSAILGPYLSILEPGISKDFAPWTVMAFSFGQMTAPVFGWWSNKIKKCRPPIVTGLFIIVVGTAAFLCLEGFPMYTRKWAMLTIRILIGFGSGILCVSRTYCATASTKAERSKAIGGSTAALGLSVIAGPGFQGLFALIGFPGMNINGFQLHMYNAPAVASIIFAFILLIVNAILLLEEYPGVEKPNNKNIVINYRPLPKYDKFGAFLLIWCWFCCWTMLANFVIIGVPFTQSQFDWSLSEALLYNGLIFAVFAGISLVVYIIYAIYGQKFDDRIPNLLGMFLMLFFWLLTFPFPGYPMPLTGTVTNMTDTNLTLVCNYTPQQWCLYTSRIPVGLYFASIIFLATGFPICNCALSAMLPKLVGPRRMGTLHGIYVTVGSLGRLLGPICMSLIFTKYGPRLSWFIPIGLVFSGILMAIIFRKRLIPLNPEPKLKSGEFYRHKLGVVYRF